MGCTSSAPNVPTPLNSEKNVSTSEGGIKEAINEDANQMYTVKENETNSTKVLPTCDNLSKPPCDILAEPTSLDRNNKSFIQMPTLDNETDREQEKDVVIETQDNKTKENKNTEPPEGKTLQTDDKITSLEEVVEKAVELFVAENSIIENAQNSAQEAQNTDKLTNSDKLQESKVDVDGSKEIDVIVPEEESEPNTEVEVEVASPSQSQSSRATRWEALADIAAELPPSLAVDPLTGQIYTLTK